MANGNGQSTATVNKVILGDGTTLIDLTNDTVDQAKVLSGYSFHDKTGSARQGTYVPQEGAKSGSASRVSTTSITISDLIGANTWSLVTNALPASKDIFAIFCNNGTITAYGTNGRSFYDISSTISFNSGTGTITVSSSAGYRIASGYFYIVK